MIIGSSAVTKFGVNLHFYLHRIRRTVDKYFYWLFVFFPTGLTIRKTVFAGVIHYGVFCTRTVISKGTKFGPFKGRIINTSEIKTNDDNSLMWEVSLLVLFVLIL